MHLLEFINYYENWEEILSKPPYNISIKTDGDYKLLKYNQIESDFDYQVVQECRGCILKRDFDGEWIYVCRPFNKFFNYGEPWAAPIDWRKVSVTEKIDGSLMKIWYDNNKWHLSTNGTIDAFKAYINEGDKTFGELFESILEEKVEVFAEECGLWKDCTYLFEMVSPENRIVIPYDYGIYYLTCYDNEARKEWPPIYSQFMRLRQYVSFPKTFQFNSLEEVVKCAEGLDSMHEGFVVRDFHGNRIKVKSPEYLRAAHLFVKGHIGKADILKMLKDGTIDDFEGYFPQYHELIKDVTFEVNNFILQVLSNWNMYCWAETRKDFALKVKNLPESDILFKKYSNPYFNIERYIWHELDTNKLIHLLGYDKEK